MFFVFYTMFPLISLRGL